MEMGKHSLLRDRVAILALPLTNGMTRSELLPLSVPDLLRSKVPMAMMHKEPLIPPDNHQP